MNRDTYSVGAVITGFLAFAAVWLYAISQWGLLFGLILGWIPALIAGVVIGLLWPAVVALAVMFALWAYNQNQQFEERSQKIALCVEEYRDKILFGNNDIKALEYFDNGYAIYKRRDGTWGAANPFETSSLHPYFTRSWKEEVRSKCRENMNER